MDETGVNHVFPQSWFPFVLVAALNFGCSFVALGMLWICFTENIRRAIKPALLDLAHGIFGQPRREPPG